MKLGDSSIHLSFTEEGLDDRAIRDVDNDSLGFRSVRFEYDSVKSPRVFEIFNWLSVWIGEDVFPSHSIASDNRPDLRGTIKINVQELQTFLDHVNDWTENNLIDEWRKACLNAAFGYYFSGLTSGIALTPVTEGLFAAAVETLGNVSKFCPAKHRRFGSRQGPHLIFEDWPDATHRKLLEADLRLLIKIRNVCGLHFGLHQKRERNNLTDDLRKWMSRHGFSEELAQASFEPDRVLDDLQRSGYSLYRTGLTVCRAAFFSVADSIGDTQYAKNDWKP